MLKLQFDDKKVSKISFSLDTRKYITYTLYKTMCSQKVTGHKTQLKSYKNQIRGVTHQWFSRYLSTRSQQLLTTEYYPSLNTLIFSVHMNDFQMLPLF